MKMIRKNSLLVNIFHSLLLLDDDFHAKLEGFMEELDDHMIEFHKLKEQEDELKIAKEEIKTLEEYINFLEENNLNKPKPKKDLFA